MDWDQYMTILGELFYTSLTNPLLLAPNGVRYAPHAAYGRDEITPFSGTSFKSRKLPENAHAVPTRSSPTTTLLAFAQGSGACIVRQPHGTPNSTATKRHHCQILIYAPN